MSEYEVKAGTTAKLGTVQGALKVGRNAKITAESGRNVVVTEGAYFEGPVTMDCNFECKSMRVEGRGWGPGGDVVVRGNLLVHGNADLDASVRVDGEVKSEDLDVAGHLWSGSLTSRRLRVGGHMKTRGSIKAETVDVGGHMTVSDEVDLAGLRVGGHAEIGGGRISGEIKVRGHLTTTRPLAYGQVKVYGNLRLPAGSSGEQLSALGKVEFEGDTSCKVIEIDGVCMVRGNCTADSVKVNGKFEASGALHVSEKLEVFGAAAVRKELRCGTLSVGGRLVADSIVTAGRADIAGEVSTSHGLKGNAVKVGTGSRVSGPIVGETVDIGIGVDLCGSWGHATNWRSIGQLTRVDDVWAKVIRASRYSHAKRIYGEVVKMQGGSMANEVNYTKEADVPESIHLEKPATKMDRLPDPPL